MSSLAALAGLEAGEGFRADARFHRAPAAAPAPSEPDPSDPVADARAEGFALGLEQGRAELAEALAAEAEAREALGLAFARLDADLAEAMRLRLTDTVMALCEATLVPFALDPEALAARVARAVAMLARAEDERVIRLNPQDLPLVSPRLSQDWSVQPDPALPRGHLRVETATGGVEDGPAQWRRALAEAFEGC